MTPDARDSQSAVDDGFHEIHLSGKQLVFLFMVTTVVSVFIFLCGVLVGRGVRTDVAEQVGAATTLVEPAGEARPAPPGAAPDVPPESAAPASEPTVLGPGETSYTALLGESQPPAERIATSAATAGPKPAEGPPPAAAPAATPEPRAAAPGGKRSGLTVQVAAVRQRKEADVIANRLRKRGYDAYVVEPDAATRMYRIRVGSYTDPAEAEQIADRLQREEKLKPWIIR